MILLFSSTDKILLSVFKIAHPSFLEIWKKNGRKSVFKWTVNLERQQEATMWNLENLVME
jgi:hypothetical protein